ncbi:hypothetical protein WAK64_11320 [Bacillus spongiae]|uniref:Thioredoxin domain-containing protein n=1 Tax=Bacillus spongiae TaxID=2683610 RepID=A0ABU8HEP4_9BACI
MNNNEFFSILITSINFFFVLLSIIIVAYLLHRLITWMIKFNEWQKSVVESENSPNFANHKKRLLNLQIPDVLVKKPGEEEQSLHHVISKNNYSLFALLNKSCIHCSINFEEFFSLSNDNVKFNYFVLFQSDEEEQAKQFLKLYNNKIDVYLVEKELLTTLKISFFPAFIVFDQQYSVKKATPIPFTAINSL